MKQITNTKGTFCVVSGFSKYAEKFRVNNDKGKWRGLWFENGADKEYPISKRELPFGNWQILGKAADILKSEELADKIVGSDINSEHDFDFEEDCLPTTLFAHFMQHHSISETDLLLIKI